MNNVNYESGKFKRHIKRRPNGVLSVNNRLPPSLYLLICLEPTNIANQRISSATCVNEHEVETGELQQSLGKILPSDVI